MKKICVITGTRADYGLLRPLINKIKEDSEFTLQLIATGMHLSPEFGLTYSEIEGDGLHIDEKLEVLLSSDSSVGISKSMGLAMISFSEVFDRLKPDLLVVLGDRYEAFAAVSAAVVAKLPVAHLHGGETTEGAFDEAFRHSITKMSYLHFTSMEQYRQRVIQLGEHPSRVFSVGALGVDSIMQLRLYEKEELEDAIGFKLDAKTLLVTYHPVTLEKSTAERQFTELLNALDKVKDIKIIFTKANADTDGRIINELVDQYVSKNGEKAVAFTSMGQVRYLSAMKYSSAVVGNSSSGILEAPSFRVPTVNIGDRQKGRVQAKSVINCTPREDGILEAINLAISEDFREKIRTIDNPYGDGNAALRIIQEIKKCLNQEIILKKTFYDIHENKTMQGEK